MARRNANNELILKTAKDRMDEALSARDTRRAEAEKAQAIYEAYADMYDELSKSLAPKPRGRSTPAPTAEKKSSRRKTQPELVPNTEAGVASATSVSKLTDRMCGVCGNDEMYTDHFKPSPNFHEFEGKKAASAA